jgi:lipoyl(octanoyl) transferase
MAGSSDAIHDRALAGQDEVHQFLHFRDMLAFAQEVHPLLGRRCSGVERAEGPSKVVDCLAAESGPTQADDVKAAGGIDVAQQEERWDVARGAASARQHAVAPDADELVDGGTSADHDAIGELGMAADGYIVREDVVVPDDGIVSGVGAGHPVVAIADGGWLLLRRPVHRDVLAEGVALADDQARPFGRSRIAQVLRGEAEADAGIADVTSPHPQRSVQMDTRDKRGPRTDANLPNENALRPDDHVFGELDVALDDRGGVDMRHDGILTRALDGLLPGYDSPPMADVLARSSLIEVRDLGRLAYASALELQRESHSAVIAARESGEAVPMPVYFLEHDPPVITVSRRPGAADHLLATPELLAAHGVTVAETDRGGDITYHGPGQLVAYPILDLNRLGLRVHSYMRWLEQIVIDTIGEFGVVGHRDACATGVWVGGARDEPTACATGASPASDGLPGGRKICAMGVRIARWVSMHGLALNVSTNLAHFGLIVPCGLVGRPVTSLARECEPPPAMATVKQVMAQRFIAATQDAVAAVASAPAPSA